MATLAAAVLAWYFFPLSGGGAGAVQTAWLQEFAWTEASLGARLAERNSRLKDAPALAAEPMLCLETAARLLCWARLAYWVRGADEAAAGALARPTTSARAEPASPGAAAAAAEPDSAASGAASAALPSSLPEAMALFPGLADHRVVYEPRSDSRAVVAWGGGRVLVAFKGTSSFENVKTDLSFFKVTHPPARTAALSATFGLRLIRVPVRVHGGFFAAWSRGGFDARVLAAAGEALAAATAAGEPPPRLLVTGHSLGGALAALAAHALVRRFPELAPATTVYTFGAPRLG
jgi:hypothetical protein